MLKNNLNNGLQPESSFYRLVNTKACYKTLKLTNQQAIIAVQTRACARLQKTETKNRNKKQKQKTEKNKEKKDEHKRNLRQSPKRA